MSSNPKSPATTDKRKGGTLERPETPKIPALCCHGMLKSVKKNHPECTRAYLKLSSFKERRVALFKSCSLGHLQIVNILLELDENKSIDSIIHSEIGLVHISCGTGQLEIVKCIVGRWGADVNLALKKDALTPLHVCASFGSVECVRYLLEKGANPRLLTSESSMNPLHFASNNGYIGCCKALIEHDETLIHSLSEKNHRSSLHFSLLNEKFDCFEWLLQNGAVMTPDINGQSALFCLPARECNLGFDFRKYFSLQDRQRWFAHSLLDLEKKCVCMNFPRGELFSTLRRYARCIKQSVDSGASLFKRISLLDFSFVGEIGRGAGVNREWFRQIEKEVCSLDMLEPCANPEVVYFARKKEGTDEDKLRNADACLMGMLSATAFTLGHVYPIPLPRFLFKCVLGELPVTEDLEQFDRELYQNKVQYLRNCTKEDLENLQLTFSHADENLKENGSETSVTKENLEEYLELYARHELFWGRDDVIRSFVSTFNLFAPRETLRAVFTHDEIYESLMGGAGDDVDTEKWREITQYQGTSPSSSLVSWFWDIVENLTAEERKHLVTFCTGSDKLPAPSHDKKQPFLLVCDKRLTPQHVPFSRTCFKTLILPNYSSKEALEEKLSLVISEQRAGHGFDFV